MALLYSVVMTRAQSPSPIETLHDTALDETVTLPLVSSLGSEDYRIRPTCDGVITSARNCIE
jgi:hypothetical protein